MYDFTLLNSADFEELVCDLLNAKESNSAIHYRVFKDGKDKGIDLLYSTEINNYEHVVQVKHYLRTGYPGLLNTLKNEELKKVKLLKPCKYIIATSVDLSVFNVEEISTTFTPFIKSLQDIYGLKDLNILLEANPDVLKRHYKLWFSSTEVLKILLNSDMEFRSAAFQENELKRRLRLYVKTPAFDDARKSLAENRFIIISGEPGVGKTSLAEMLIYEYIKDGFNLTYILDDIKEAERVLSHDDSKQIIYFDDFLGSNSIEINRAKGSETRLLKILRRINSEKNKFFIFTTRSFLLKTAQEESENLRRFNIKTQTSILNLTEYTTEIRKQILLNHIEESKLSSDLKQILGKSRIQSFIVNHKNFTPRSVEFITSERVFSEYSKEQFEKEIIKNFNQPDEIWRHAYSEQILEDDRILLNTLLSFGFSTSIESLEVAFNHRMDFEIENNNKTKVMHAFKKAFKRLDEGFIILRHDSEVEFINPSLIDFLMNYIRGDKDEIARMAGSVRFTKQLSARLFTIPKKKGVEIPSGLQEKILSDYSFFIQQDNYEREEELITLAMVIYHYIKSKEAQKVILDILNDIDEWVGLFDYKINGAFRDFLEYEQDNPVFREFIENKLLDILACLIQGQSDPAVALQTLDDFKGRFGLQYELQSVLDIEYSLEEMLNEMIESEIDWLKGSITSEGEEEEVRKKISDLLDEFEDLGFDLEVDLEEFDKYDWFDIAVENEIRRQMSKPD